MAVEPLGADLGPRIPGLDSVAGSYLVAGLIAAAAVLVARRTLSRRTGIPTPVFLVVAGAADGTSVASVLENESLVNDGVALALFAWASPQSRLRPASTAVSLPSRGWPVTALLSVSLSAGWPAACAVPS